MILQTHWISLFTKYMYLIPDKSYKYNNKMDLVDRAHGRWIVWTLLLLQ